MTKLERIQGEIEDLIRQDNRDFDFNNVCPTIDWRDTRALAEYVIKAKIKELRKVNRKFEGYIDLRIEELENE